MSWLETFADIRNKDWSQEPDSERKKASQEVVSVASYAAAAASIVPVPLADVALLLPVHTTMVMTVGHVYGRNLSDAEAKRVALELGAIAGVTLAGRAALSALKKLLLPGIGGFLAAPAAFGVTWALGQVSMAYFEDPELSKEDLKKVFSEAFKEGKSAFSKEKLENFQDEQGEETDGETEVVEPEVMEVEFDDPKTESVTKAQVIEEPEFDDEPVENPRLKPKKRSL